MQVLNLKIDLNCFNFCIELDECHVRFSERSLTEKAKEAGQSSRSYRKEDKKNFNLKG